MQPKFHRKHGLSRPLGVQQVLTWLLTFLSLAIQVLFHVPFGDRASTIQFSILHAILYALGVILFVFATMETHPRPLSYDEAKTKYCRFCDTMVPVSAKHCRACNNCRMGFDHHCVYINNCVTKDNYTEFFYGILFLASQAILQLLQTSLILYDAVNDMQKVLGRGRSFYKAEIPKAVVYTLIGVSYLANLGMCVPLCVLIGYHVYFQSHQITTIDFIMKTVDLSKKKLINLCCAGSTKRIYAS